MNLQGKGWGVLGGGEGEWGGEWKMKEKEEITCNIFLI